MGFCAPIQVRKSAATSSVVGGAATVIVEMVEVEVPDIAIGILFLLGRLLPALG
jgi:hypothetical protein